MNKNLRNEQSCCGFSVWKLKSFISRWVNSWSQIAFLFFKGGKSVVVLIYGRQMAASGKTSRLWRRFANCSQKFQTLIELFFVRLLECHLRLIGNTRSLQTGWDGGLLLGRMGVFSMTGRMVVFVILPWRFLEACWCHIPEESNKSTRWFPNIFITTESKTFWKTRKVNKSLFVSFHDFFKYIFSWSSFKYFFHHHLIHN